MIRSWIAGAATRQSVPLKTCASPRQLWESLSEQSVRLVILDLATSDLNVSALVLQLRALDNPPQVIAFGPHVHADRLAAAREAGCDQVMSRGQFHAQADEWLKLARD